jgi:hypothetical protein
MMKEERQHLKTSLLHSFGVEFCEDVRSIDGHSHPDIYIFVSFKYGALHHRCRSFFFCVCVSFSFTTLASQTKVKRNKNRKKKCAVYIYSRGAMAA